MKVWLVARGLVKVWLVAGGLVIKCLAGCWGEIGSKLPGCS